jgi:diguanylate cyclase
MASNISILPVYTATPEQNAEYLRQILPLMSKHKIAVDPINFALFYDYVAGRNSALNTELDALLTTQTIFTAELSLQLFQKHICNTSVHSLEKINQSLMQLINKTDEAIDSTEEKATEASINFQNQSKKLENNHGIAEIKAILAEIIAETKELSESSLLFQAKLNDSKNEIQLLRMELTRVKETAITDALTGLLNRRAFDQKLHEHIENYKNSAGELCLLILDLDHFKRINDNFGHLVGDNVLRYTAKLMQQHIAGNHYAARYGGEEMAVIMPDTPLSKAMEIAEKIRRSLAQYPLQRKDNSESIGKVTLSVGVSACKVHDTLDSLIDRADKALYQAKNNGRNQVMVEHFI